MIKKLKRRVILLSSVSLLVLLTVIVAGMNLINYSAVKADADEILSLLSGNEGRFPGASAHLPPHLSPELPYESRYFSVLFTRGGSVIYTDTGRIISVDSSTAIDYAAAVLGASRESGFSGQFRYLVSAEGDTVRVTFLDCGRQLDSFYRFLTTSILMALAGFLLIFLVICFCAGRIVRPIAESYEKQKRFITDAGHEIKTPLTVIKANVDLLEMENGQSESLDDIRAQANRLTALTENLILLSRMEEAGSTLPMIEFPVSEVVSDTAAPFRALAEVQGKSLDLAVLPLLSMRGNSPSIEQLVTLLLDNALKYSPVGSTVHLRLEKQNHGITLTVSNETLAPIDKKELDRVFERFYRADPSRSSETGGHGIGLSVAKAIVTAHGGRIRAASPDGHTFTVTAMLPIS